MVGEGNNNDCSEDKTLETKNYEEETRELEKIYKEHRLKHVQGLFKDIEMPRDKYGLLSMMFISIGCLLSMLIDLSIYRSKDTLTLFSIESYLGLIVGMIVGAIFSGIKLDHEEKRLTITQVLLLIGTINLILQINYLGILGGFFTFWTFFIASFTLTALFLIVITLFLDYSSILERGRVLAFIFMETIIAVAFFSILIHFGFKKLPILLYSSIIIPLLTFGFITKNKKEFEKPALKLPKKTELHVNMALIGTMFFIFIFSFTYGLAVPINEIEQFLTKMAEYTEPNLEMMGILTMLIMLSTVIALIVGYIFDFFGRLLTISILILLISITTFLGLIKQSLFHVHEIVLLSCFLVVIMSITLLIGDITKREHFGKVLTFTFTICLIGVNLGQLLRYNLPIWLINQDNSDIMLLGMEYLSSVLCLVLLVNTKETLPHKEKEWYESLLHLYIVHKSGILIYDHEFLTEAGKLQSDLVSGGIIGLTTILNEIVKGRERLRTIDHGDKKVLFKYSPEQDIIFVLLIKEDLIVLRKKLDQFTSCFLEEYASKLKDLTYVNVKDFKNAVSLVEMIFERKYFEMISPLINKS